MEKVSFDLFGLTLLEPLSVLTNWLMAFLCISYFNTLKPNNDYLKFWRRFFLLYAGSFIFGGLSHLFFHYSSMTGKIPGWTCALLGVTFAEWAMTFRLDKPELIRILIVIKICLSFIFLGIDFKFLWVMLHTTGLLFFVCLPALTKWIGGLLNFKYFVYSIFFLLLTAPIKLLKIDFHPAYFNRDDISHVFIIISLGLIFKGVRLTGVVVPQGYTS